VIAANARTNGLTTALIPASAPLNPLAPDAAAAVAAAVLIARNALTVARIRGSSRISAAPAAATVTMVPRSDPSTPDSAENSPLRTMSACFATGRNDSPIDACRFVHSAATRRVRFAYSS